MSLANALAVSPRGQQPGAARRSAAARAAAEGQSSRRRRHLRARACARRRGHHAGGARPVPARDVAPGATGVRVHVGAVLRRQAGIARRARPAAAGGRRCVRWGWRVVAAGAARRQPELVGRGDRTRCRRCSTVCWRRAHSGWTRNGGSRPLTPADVLVVAPYNAHVNRLADALSARGVRVGTVDKFQGQEAPVVIYSMASSSPNDAPRGMEFLYSLNRLNVATSRARCAAFVVASPRLLAAGVPHPAADAPRQRAVPFRRDGARRIVTGPVTETS